MSRKVLHILSFDWGGAANAALRLHEGMLEAGIDSKVLLKWKSRKDVKKTFEFVLPIETYPFKKKLNNKINQYKKKIFGETPVVDYLKNAPKGFHLFTIPNEKYDIASNPLVQEADIIHLHWVADFINYKSFFQKINKPVVWTMHDMNPFTGGCHYAMECLKYEDKCLNCPQLVGTFNPDFAYEIQQKKAAFCLGNNNLHIVTPSQWLTDCSKRSQIFKDFPHYVIYNGIDSRIFKNRDKVFSRDLLGLPHDKKIVLFVAGSLSCKPKGYQLLLDAFNKLSDKTNILLCAIGNDVSEIKNAHIVELGPINDERLLSAAYSASDIYITPSLVEAFGLTIAESMFCATPVIGYSVSAVKELIDNKKNGILCSETNSESLKEAIDFFYNNTELFDGDIIAEDARNKYDINIITSKYKVLYESIL